MMGAGYRKHLPFFLITGTIRKETVIKEKEHGL